MLLTKQFILFWFEYLLVRSFSHLIPYQAAFIINIVIRSPCLSLYLEKQSFKLRQKCSMESYSFPLAKTYFTIIITIVEAIIRNYHLFIRSIIQVQIPWLVVQIEDARTIPLPIIKVAKWQLLLAVFGSKIMVVIGN